MDASIYTERSVRPSKPTKIPKKEVREQMYQAKLQEEMAHAAKRLCPILYRKAKIKGQLIVRLSQATLDRLEHNHDAVSATERTSELLRELSKYLDGHGLVNARVIKDEEDRLDLTQQIVAQALESGDIETITGVSKLTIVLSDTQMQVQKPAAVAHESRIREQRAARRGVPAVQ